MRLFEASIWRGCRSSWRRHERPGELPTGRPLADRRGGPPGPRSPRSLRPGQADDHHAKRRNRLRRLGGRPRSRICPRLDWLSLGRPARKVTRSRAKEPPNFSTTAPSRSSSNTETATKPSLKPNGILLQQPARRRRASRPGSRSGLQRTIELRRSSIALCP
jgi:hypothetical protein